MLRELPAREVRAWVAHFNREMWPEERADIRAAVIAFHVYHAVPRRARRQLRDFLITPRDEGKRERVEAFKRALMARARRIEHADH